MDAVAKSITYFFLYTFCVLIGLPVIVIVFQDPFYRIVTIISGLSIIIYTVYSNLHVKKGY